MVNAECSLYIDILEATQEGRVSDWNERIARVAQAAHLDISSIRWCGSPADAAFSVVEEARVSGKLDALRVALLSPCQACPETSL